MLIEVTKKEAMDIYSQRYIEGKNKLILLKIVPILLIALIAGLWIMDITVNNLLGVVAFVVIASPAIYLTFRLARASGKYARRQIEERSYLRGGEEVTSCNLNRHKPNGD